MAEPAAAPVRAVHAVRPRRLGAETLAVLAVALAVLLVFADRDGYEGDDINSVVPMLHLPEAIEGRLLIYRYAWQPLSYWLGHGVFAATGSVGAIFALAPVAMALGIALIYRTVRGHAGLPPLLFLPLLLLFPEILFTGLYFNSSALGFPLAALAVLMSFEGRSHGGAALTGLALGLSVLMRMDFVLIAPAIGLFRLWYTRSWTDFGIVVAAGFATLGAGYAIGLLQPEALIGIYETARGEIVARAGMPGWNDRTKLFVATTVLSPAGWIAAGLAGLWILRNRRLWLPAAVGLVCLAPMLLAARDILTPKYMIPAYALLPVVVALIWDHARRTGPARLLRPLGILWGTVTLASLLISVEPRPRPPFVIVTATDPFQVGTHDGWRSWGAYLWQMSTVRAHDDTGGDTATELAAALLSRGEGPDIVLAGGQNVFDQGGVAWRHLQLRLERAGYRGEVTAPNEITFELPGRRIILSEEATPRPGACTVPLETDPDARADPISWIDRHC